MLVGYARTSTVDQSAGLEGQVRDLEAAGCEQIFREQVSATSTKRPELQAALQFIRRGDVLVATKPDRLARSVSDLLDIVDKVVSKSATLKILSMGGGEVDTKTPTGKLTLSILGAVSEFERALMLERQREGIAKAKSQGRYKGRAPTVQRQAQKILSLHAEGVNPTNISRQLRIGRSSVYRVLGSTQKNSSAPAGRVSEHQGDET